MIPKIHLLMLVDFLHNTLAWFPLNVAKVGGLVCTALSFCRKQHCEVSVLFSTEWKCYLRLNDRLGLIGRFVRCKGKYYAAVQFNARFKHRVMLRFELVDSIVGN